MILFSEIISNLKANGALRWAELEGRRYAVVPVVMAGVGVLNGSKGALFYPPEEFDKSASDWNGRPIIVYHSELNGVEVSAASPEIFERQRVGIVFNASFVDGKLKAEAWIDEVKANLVDPRVMKAITTNAKMEVSTGLRVDVINEAGSFGESAFIGKAVNHRPDHLALLPDQIGAFSVADGGGLLANKKGEGLDEIGFNPKRIDSLIGNALSFGDIRKRLSSLLRERFPSSPAEGDGPSSPRIWVEEVFDKFVIYEREDATGSSLFSLSYSRAGDEISLGGEIPLQVFSSQVFKTADGRVISNSEGGSISMAAKFDKKAFVDGIIANEKSPFGEDDRASLMDMAEPVLKKLESVEKPAESISGSDPEAVANAAKKGAAPVSGAPQNDPPAKPKTMTLEEVIANASPEDQDAFQEMKASHQREKGQLISVIVGNERNAWTKEELSSMRLPQLRKIAALAAGEKKEDVSAVANYAGSIGSSGDVEPSQAPLGLPKWE